jgi:transcriptional regulator with XRE-family HTH domain
LTRTTISSIESGRHMPRFDSVVAMCRVYDESPETMAEALLLASPVDPEDPTLAVRACDDLGARAAIDRAEGLLRRAAIGSSEAAAKEASRRTGDDSDSLARVYGILAEIWWAQDFRSLALDAAHRSVELSATCGREIRARALVLRARLHLASSRPGEARRDALNARALTTAGGGSGLLADAERVVGLGLAHLNARGRARDWLARALVRSRRHGLGVHEAMLLLDLGGIALEENRARGAEAMAAGALRAPGAADSPIAAFRAAWLRARASLLAAPPRVPRHLLASLSRRYPGVLGYRTELDVLAYEASPWFRRAL